MNFLKTFWAALLAFVVANVVIGILAVMMLAGVVAMFSTDSSTTVKSNSILKIDLKDAITDSPELSPIGTIDFMSMKIRTSNSLLDVLNAIEYASLDPNIRGIYLELNSASAMSSANREELRAELEKFKESGKFVVSYSEVYPQGAYYLASVSNKVYMNPEGGLMWQGMAANVMFYKGLLDKLGIQPEVLRHGSFKAAVEPFIMDKMSPENRLQMNTLLDATWGTVVGDIAKSRGIDSATLQGYASELRINSPKAALECKLVDSLIYNDQMMGVLNTLIGEDADSQDEPSFVSIGHYIGSMKPTATKISKNKIAIIYAEGEIIDGDSDEGKVGSATMAKKLEKVRNDDNVKALVLRINSPGGSALASEVMWREIELIRKDKPVVVSMGGVAASGGYYIAAPADIILANKTTITGSIGVFGLMFNAEKGLKDKLGITVDVVKTNTSADMITPFRSITAAERAYGMHEVERVYNTFVGHVATGRNLSVEQVDAIGGGRVWSGLDAQRIGLIDGFGGVKHAIELAADRAGIAQDFRVSQVVDQDDRFTAIFRSLSSSIRSSRMKSELGDAIAHYNNLMSIIETKGMQARMPYIIDIN